MTRITILPVLGFCLFCLMPCCSEKEEKTLPDYPIRPVDFTKVTLHDGFWKEWVETASHHTIPFAFQKCEETGRVDNFIFAGGIRQGKFRGDFGFDDSDVYKVMEGASYSLMLEDNPRLDIYLDSLIYYISEAQEDDGYLYTAKTLNANDYNDFKCCTYSDEGRWIGTTMGSHEFYNAGHMYESAVAHFLATGKRNFLDVAIKNADLVYEVCMVQKKLLAPQHQEIEIGLIKLFRVTGEEKYLALAKHLLDIRALVIKDEYAQGHLPVTEQTEAVGHAVRANYMYAAMTDIAALTGDTAYGRAVKNIWNNVVQKKLSITGGVGASHQGEAYGADYELPNHPYNETCAAIANVYWNHRMFMLYGDAAYIDVVERSLYNGVLSGLSLDGVKFFYTNTLQHDGVEPFNMGVNGRSSWFDCSCCPSNLSRFIPSVAGYAYAQKDSEIYINLFMNGEVSMETSGGNITIKIDTHYPWEGNIDLAFLNQSDVDARIHIRIPGWARDTPVPSDLFRFEGSGMVQPTLFVNGTSMEMEIDKGYVTIDGRWNKGDHMTLNLPMEVRKAVAHEKVEQKRGLVALQYGPVIYCAEEEDNREDVINTGIRMDSEYQVSFDPQLLGGVNKLEGGKLKLIPYFAWANRGTGKMNVWFQMDSP
jgi:DUF1680 family protein